MTSSDDPDRIRREIEHTQANLSTDVNALTEKVTPGRIVARRVDRAKAAGRRLTDRVMGSNDPTPATPVLRRPLDRYRDGTRHRHGAVGVGERLRHGAVGVGERLRRGFVGRVDDLGHGVVRRRGGAGRAAGRTTADQGNPLAAGVIAFGAGWLISSLLPASRQEQRLAEQTTEKAARPRPSRWPRRRSRPRWR